MSTQEMEKLAESLAGKLVGGDSLHVLLQERNSLQDQRDFAMGEIERLRKERDEFRHALRVIARMDTSRGNTRALLSVAVAKDALGLETPKH